MEEKRRFCALLLFFISSSAFILGFMTLCVMKFAVRRAREAPVMPIIKRYNNRKLYDTHAKRYVTLFDLAEMIRRGDDVTVLDHGSGEDITSQIQAQIIFEQEREAGGGLPNTVLTSIIQASNQTIKQLRTSFLPLDVTARMDSEIERRMMLLMERGDISKRQGTRILEKLLSVRPQARSPQELKIERALEKRGTPTRREVQELAKHVAELTRELEALNARPSRKRRSPVNDI
jgi:polyhydroxyalkanoate synthesis repressor PhaR